MGMEKKIFKLSLLTDLYQLTMVRGYWKSNIYHRKATFHLNYRKWPFQGGFALFAGLQTVIDFISRFKFSFSDLQYLRSLKNSEQNPLFEEEFIHFLSRFKFECDVDAMLEGTPIFPYQPMIRVQGPIWQAQLLESPLLNILNFQTLIATKSARICRAAYPDPVIEFGMRRAQGFDGAISASRAAFIGGCESTSHVLAGKLFNIPVRGTHAHSWVMAFDREEDSFQEFIKSMPKDCVLLIDTYDTIDGVKRAIEVSRLIEGFELAGVRLDSGDLCQLSIKVRKILDEAGFFHTKIMASNELDEFQISDLKRRGAQIAVWGVGTHLVTGSEQAALDGVYKLSAVEDEKGNWLHKLKLSNSFDKITNPGMLQVRRFFDGNKYVGDLIYDEFLNVENLAIAVDFNDPGQEKKFENMQFQDLLVPIFRKGKKVFQSHSIHEMQAFAKNELEKFPSNVKKLIDPDHYFSGLEKNLFDKKMEMIHSMKKKERL